MMIVILALGLGLGMAVLKTHAYLNWQYTSDLFTYETIAQETLRGNPGVEFTYGNSFGDHAYLYLFLITALKPLLNTDTIYLMLWFGPIFYTTSAVVIFFALQKAFDLPKAFLVTLCYLFGYGFFAHGLLEKTYGMHPDTVSGFLATALTALLICREKMLAQGQSTKGLTRWIVATLVAFFLLKEEMALLAIFLFFWILLFRRNRYYLKLALFSCAAFLLDWMVIHFSQTSFNRTNQALFAALVEGLRQHGLLFFFMNPEGNQSQLILFWSVILIAILTFGVSLALSRKLNPFTTGLFLLGLIKVGFSFSTVDMAIFSWHNFPALVMFTSAVLFQTLFIDRLPKPANLILLGALSIAALFCFIRIDLPFMRQEFYSNKARAASVEQFRGEIEQLKQHVAPHKIIAVPLFTVQSWVGYRYTFFPRGVFWSPEAVADYILYPSQDAAAFTGVDAGNFPLTDVLKISSVVDQTPHFLLLKRTVYSESDYKSRQSFFKTLGLSEFEP